MIFDHSSLGSALSSRAAREEVSTQTRVCSYDRVGMGWSDPGPEVISAGFLADDLERLTIQAELRPPFILAPASLGGITAEMFARRHPEKVAGLVFVDAGNSAISEFFADRVNWMELEAACLLKPAARIGALRLFDPLGLRGDTSGEAARTIWRIYRVEPMATLCGIARGLRTTARELDAAPPLPQEVPLVVLVHERPDGLLPPGLGPWSRAVEHDWVRLQQGFAQRSRRGTWRIVPGSDHLIGSSQPHSVASAILELVAEVRRAQ